MVKSAKECIKEQASNSEMYGRMQAVFIEMDTAPNVSALVMYNHMYLFSFYLLTIVWIFCRMFQ